MGHQCGGVRSEPCYTSHMKKNTVPARLKLNLETMKTLKVGELQNVNGGVSSPHICPTTTFTSLEICP